MNLRGNNRILTFSTIFRIIGLLLIMVLAMPVFAQNTKGDRPASSREGRFKTPSKRVTQKRKPGKRVKARKQSVASNAREYTPRKRARGGDRPGRPLRPIARSKPQSKERAWSGDIAGRRIRATTARERSKNVYPQYGRYTRNPSRTPKPAQKIVSNKSALTRLKKLQTPASARKVYPQKGRYVNNSSRTPRSTQNAVSNRGTLARVKKLQSQPGTRRIYPQKGRFVNNPSRTPRSTQNAVPNRGTLARAKKLQSSSPRIYRKSINVYANFRRPKRKGEQASTKDLAGRRLRNKNYESPRPGSIEPFLTARQRKPQGSDRPYKGPAGGYKSATRDRQEAWQGDVAGRRIRGRNFSSKKSIEGQPFLPGRQNRDRSGDRPYSGKAGWFRTASRSSESRPGMGPLPARTPGIGGSALRGYDGKITGRKPLKGGGSVSGRGWNNDGRPIEVRTPRGGAVAALYQGNIKAKPREKGGGSISGKLWNNRETPIPGKTYSDDARKVSGYPGKNRMFDLHPGFIDQGARYTGPIKLKKFKRSYTQHPDAAEASVKKKRLSRNAFAAEGLQVKVKERDYARKPYAADGASPGIKPTKASVKASEYARSIRRNWDYIRNPSSSEEALRTREPGKAFALSSAYQGNIRMQKFKLFEKNRNLHPDTRFIKINKNNVPEEKDLLTNFRLWWARLFKKEETQPDHLKEKGHKPRYDKGEAGMWYE